MRCSIALVVIALSGFAAEANTIYLSCEWRLPGSHVTGTDSYVISFRDGIIVDAKTPLKCKLPSLNANASEDEVFFHCETDADGGGSVLETARINRITGAYTRESDTGDYRFPFHGICAATTPKF